MMTIDQALDVINKMSDLERMALRRCAQYQMRYEDLEEIGTSDVSCRAAEMIRSNAWPALGDVPIGFLVDEYSEALEGNPEVTPSEVHGRIVHDGNYKNCLPNFAYEGKHLLSKESTEMYNAMREMFAPV